ncbi:hypothetical protein BS47DRAFT_1368956 [Hydnum rufescens UP504]|uniref:Uncharacterized protein n=1 Tax=Hydnum rufescens UP504 TaxID=1448309 RepID=A0A9P6DMK5_9AGAM|nr:hypothetical protein BS47DRAFT_1368956 [Hydnum rufescens UP504]
MTTHLQQWVCGHVRLWPGGLKEKPANDKGQVVRVQMTIDHVNHTPTAADHHLNHKKPLPNECPLPKTTTCAPPPNHNLLKPCQKTTRATGTTHLLKGCIGFQGCLSVPTTHTNCKLKTPDPPDKTWKQGCTTQDTRNTRWNHTPASAGVVLLEMRHKPHTENTPNEPHTHHRHHLNWNPPNEPPPPKQPTTE